MHTASILRFGFGADGVFKVLVAIAYGIGAGWFSEVLDLPLWLLALTAGLVLLSGLAELTFAIRRGAGSHTPVLIAYDSGWVLVTLLVLLLASWGFAHAGTLWFGYQGIGSSVLTVLFLRGAFGPVPARSIRR